MIYITAAIVLWSSLGIVIRLSSLPVVDLIFFSCLISTGILGVLLLGKERRREIQKLKGLMYLLVLGPISLVNSFSFFYAYKNTTVANAVLTHYTAPVLVAFLAPVFLRERLTGRVVAAVTVATLGLWVMLDVSVRSLVSLPAAGDRNTGGILAGLLSGFAYAVLVILFRVFAQTFNPLVMTFSQNLVIAALLLPFIDFGKEYRPSLWALATMGVIHSTIAPILYFRGMREVTANRAAILGYIEPVCAIALGFLFLGETITYQTVLGGWLILFSGYLTRKDGTPVVYTKGDDDKGGVT